MKRNNCLLSCIPLLLWGISLLLPGEKPARLMQLAAALGMLLLILWWWRQEDLLRSQADPAESVSGDVKWLRGCQLVQAGLLGYLITAIINSWLRL